MLLISVNYPVYLGLALHIQVLSTMSEHQCMHLCWHTDLCMVFFILLKHLDDQFCQANGVLQFFCRGDQPAYIL